MSREDTSHSIVDREEAAVRLCSGRRADWRSMINGEIPKGT